MKRVIIIGGGVSGLVASHVFKQCKGLDIKIMEPGKPGGEFLAGGLKYIHRTDAMAALLNDLGMVYSNYGIRGGIMLHGSVEPYPKCLQDMEPDRAQRIRADHYMKTRRQVPEDFGSKAMNDPEDVSGRRALRCDSEQLIKKLAAQADFIKSRLSKITPGFVITERGNSHPYDYLVLTIPLWITRHVAHFHVPEGHAMRLNLISVEAQRDEYSKWDYVYTPYTPANVIHRISPMDGGYTCEANGELDREQMESDLNFIFKSGYYIREVKEGLKGHLLPLPARPEWPDNVVPLGRFAKWDPRSTLDVVLDDAHAITEHWGWQTTA